MKSSKESVSQQYAREQLAKQMQPFYTIYREKIMPIETPKKLYLVDTIVMFRHKYVIEANELDHAYDEVTMRDSGSPNDDFNEVSQRFLGETISDGREITKEEFNKLLTDLKNDKNEISSHWLDDQLIRKINYDRT